MIYWRISAGAGGIMNELTDAKFISWALVRHKSRRRASIARPATIHTRRPYDPTQLVCRTLLDRFFRVRRAAARQAPGPYRFRSHVLYRGRTWFVAALAAADVIPDLDPTEFICIISNRDSDLFGAVEPHTPFFKSASDALRRGHFYTIPSVRVAWLFIKQSIY